MCVCVCECVCLYVRCVSVSPSALLIGRANRVSVANALTINARVAIRVGRTTEPKASVCECVWFCAVCACVSGRDELGVACASL